MYNVSFWHRLLFLVQLDNANGGIYEQTRRIIWQITKNKYDYRLIKLARCPKWYPQGEEEAAFIHVRTQPLEQHLSPGLILQWTSLEHVTAAHADSGYSSGAGGHRPMASLPGSSRSRGASACIPSAPANWHFINIYSNFSLYVGPTGNQFWISSCTPSHLYIHHPSHNVFCRHKCS